MKTLKDAKVGEIITVLKIHGEGATKGHIMNMGVTKGSKIKVVRLAPLGDPIEITVRSYQLSLRKSEASIIEVE